MDFQKPSREGSIVTTKNRVLFFMLFVMNLSFLLLSGVVLAQSEEGLGWKVWVKTSPCSGRFDWVTVAKKNPTEGPGPGFWTSADLILTGTGMSCVRPGDESCTFAAANAEAAIVRASDKFSNYCCREY